jgi:hypothetical protein
MMSVTRCTLPTISVIVAPASATKRVPVSTLSTLAPIRLLISLAASALRCASERTSPATTANPRPCSPARAASTAALSARMLVWKAMPSMVPMMSAMRRLLWLMRSMVLTTSVTTAPPRSALLLAWLASWLAVRAASAVWFTVAVSWFIAEAVCCRLAAVCSVRWLRSWLPLATSELATWMLSAAERTLPTMRCRLSCMSTSERDKVAASSAPCTCISAVRSPSRTPAAKSSARFRGTTMEADTVRPSQTMATTATAINASVT